MVTKAGSGCYDKYNSNHAFKNAQHLLEQKNKNPQQSSKTKSLFSIGGVKMDPNQVRSAEEKSINDHKGYEVVLENGMKIHFMDQCLINAAENRFNDFGEIEILPNGAVRAYNIHHSSIFGTEKSEVILLDICENTLVDGGGGKDTYASRQVKQFSNNTYIMHNGDYSLKNAYNKIINCGEKIITEENCTFNDKPYYLHDTAERYEEKERMQQEYEEMQKQRQESLPESIRFKTEDLGQDILTDEDKSNIIKKAKENYTKIELEKQILKDFEKGKRESYAKSMTFEVEALQPAYITKKHLDLIAKQKMKNLEEMAENNNQLYSKENSDTGFDTTT